MKFANIPVEIAQNLIKAFSFDSPLVAKWAVDQTKEIQQALSQIEFPIEEKEEV